MTRHIKILTIFSAFIASLLLMGAATQESTQKRVGDAYPLATCPVSGRPLGDNPIVVVLSETPRASDKGREVRFCCNGCRGNFEKDLKTNLPELDKKIIKAQMPYYPAGNCVVMTSEPMAAPDTPEAMTEGLHPQVQEESEEVRRHARGNDHQAAVGVVSSRRVRDQRTVLWRQSESDRGREPHGANLLWRVLQQGQEQPGSVSCHARRPQDRYQVRLRTC